MDVLLSSFGILMWAGSVMLAAFAGWSLSWAHGFWRGVRWARGRDEGASAPPEPPAPGL
ncbi:hypothetical protein [Longimicrobium sp.]|jgi:hypothetical protein|uniref:hypothetical protein n=1 Tax=Longimicrobium sp. TaxID=2029185 RepID=UPI002ED7F2BA